LHLAESVDWQRVRKAVQSASRKSELKRGEDTVDAEDQVTFADFSPNVRPADAPDPVEALPKGESAPAPAPSSESSEKTVQQTSDTSAPTPASKDDGKPSPSESSKQTSSSDQKTG
jgi:hypothetical protein